MTAGPALSAAELDELLPWRHPFRMVDRMIECVPHERIETSKEAGGSDLLARAAGHPGFAGAMILEGLNQSAALLYQLTYGRFEPARLPLLGYLEAELRGPAAPGAALHFAVRAVKMTPTHGLFVAEAAAGDRILARSELGFAVAAAPEGTAP